MGKKHVPNHQPAFILENLAFVDHVPGESGGFAFCSLTKRTTDLDLLANLIQAVSQACARRFQPGSSGLKYVYGSRPK